jgi:hypothetical protein
VPTGVARPPGVTGTAFPIPAPGLNDGLDTPIGQELKWTPPRKSPPPVDFPLTDGPIRMLLRPESTNRSLDGRDSSEGRTFNALGANAKAIFASRDARGSSRQPSQAEQATLRNLDEDVVRRAEIETEMRKPRAENRYWAEPAMQDEYRNLLGRTERERAPLPPRPGDASRKAEIEATMREGRAGAYWRAGSTLPDEYRAILDREIGEA